MTVRKIEIVPRQMHELCVLDNATVTTIKRYILILTSVRRAATFDLSVPYSALIQKHD